MIDPTPRRLPPALGDAALVRPHYVDIPGYGYQISSEAPENPGLAEYWNIIRRRKGTLFLITFLCVLIAILITLLQTRVYQARTTLEIQDVNQNFLNMQQVNPISEGAGYQPVTDMQTQIKILQSAFLIDRVLDRLNIHSPADMHMQASRLSAWRKALNLREPPSPELREVIAKQAADNLTISASGKTRIVEVSFDSIDPRFAASFANTLASEFIQQNIEARWKMNQSTGEWLSHQLEDMRIKLERSEDALQAYARRSGLMFTGDKQSVSEEKLRQLQQELSRAQADRIASQSRFEMLRNAPLDLLPQAVGDTAMSQIQARLADLRRQKAELTVAYADQHYKVQRIQAQIASLEKTILEERTAVLGRLQKDYDAALRREKLLAAGYDAQSLLVNQESEKAIQYNIFKREVDSNRQIYDVMLQRVKEASVAAAMRASNVRVVDPARPPRFPYKPRIVINAALGLLSGLFLGMAFIVARESADRSIQDPGDLGFYLDVPELGVVPNASARPLGLSYYSHRKTLKKAASDGSGKDCVELVTWQKKPSLVSESFRSVIASVLFTGKNGDRPRVLVLTSPSPQEGKTTVASNLAIALAAINHRVVLIDADLRKPRLHEIFGLDNESGLSTYLTSSSPSAAMARNRTIPNLTVITSGPPSLDATSLLHSPRVKELLENLRKDYDMVLLDTPPMLQMSDARVLGRLADGVIIVTRAGHTNRDDVVAARQRFAQDGTAVLGTILNDWNPRSTRHGHYGHSKSYYQQ